MENYDRKKVDEVVLALMQLILHDFSRAWKGFDWDTLDHLYEKGWIEYPKGTVKSVVLTEEGLAKSAHLFQAYFGMSDKTQQEKDSNQVWRDDLPTMLSISSCSFCGKQQDQIKQFTTGPGGVHICNECVDYCREIVENGTGDFQQIRQDLASRKKETRSHSSAPSSNHTLLPDQQ